jgi:hypothetical protein
MRPGMVPSRGSSRNPSRVESREPGRHPAPCGSKDGESRGRTLRPVHSYLRPDCDASSFVSSSLRRRSDFMARVQAWGTRRTRNGPNAILLRDICDEAAQCLGGESGPYRLGLQGNVRSPPLTRVIGERNPPEWLDARLVIAACYEEIPIVTLRSIQLVSRSRSEINFQENRSNSVAVGRLLPIRGNRRARAGLLAHLCTIALNE